MKVNYQGPSFNRQVWTWQLFSWSTNAYVTVGDNSAITPPLDWLQWTVFNFSATGPLANYVRASDGQMRVQIFSNNAVDDTYLDYEAVVVTSTAGVNVSVAPTAATLIGGGTQQFTATVTGSSNTSVTWAVTGAGTASTSGLYTAPATVANTTTATVKATSVADTTKSASATVTINPVSVAVSPMSASLGGGGTQQFAATVTNGGGTGVTWSLTGLGTLSSSGLYTAPATVSATSTATVTATSTKDTTKSASATVTLSAVSGVPLPLHGVTVADDKDIRASSYLNQVLTSLGNLSVTPTVRIVFTQGAPASGYVSAAQQIKTNRYVLGMVVDSSSMPCYTVAQHSARWQEYIATVGNSVDIWEVGNEINGNWLYGNQGTGCTGTTQADVVTKMTDAYNQAKTTGKATALTLFFNVDSTCAASDPQMTTWASTNVPTSMKNGLDYVLVSFYPQWCTSNPYSYTPDWNTVFSNLRSIFPNAKLGMGEIGWDSSKGKPSNANLTTLIQTDSRIKPTSVTNWAAGGFYWEFGLDAVPYNGTAGSIWNVINTELANQ